MGMGVLRNRGTRMTERDAEREWGGQQANLVFFRLAWGLHGAISISVPGWGMEPLDQLALTLVPLMPPPLLTSRQLHPISWEATRSFRSWGESQVIESWHLSILDLLVMKFMIYYLFL